jgi:hypothetical protein
MASYGMLRRVALIRTDVSEDSCDPDGVLTRATRRDIPEDAILRLESFVEMRYTINWAQSLLK